MADRVIAALYRTRKTIDSVLEELDINEVDSNEVYKEINECSHCGHWFKHRELREDLDGFPICNVCREFYGD